MSKVFEGDIDERPALLKPRFGDRELLNVHILCVVERIAVDGADFTFGPDRILPDHVGETLLKIFVEECATSRLKKRSAFLLVGLVEIGHQRVGRHCPAGRFSMHHKRRTQSNKQCRNKYAWLDASHRDSLS